LSSDADIDAPAHSKSIFGHPKPILLANAGEQNVA
jgi:hypothetical protein